MPRLALIIAIAISMFSPRQGELPSVVGAKMFVSLDGRFSISLPNHNGLGPLIVPTRFGNAKGDMYRWVTKEGTFGVGYADAPQPLDGPETTKDFLNAAIERFNKVAKSNSGNIGAVKQITLEKYPGVEQRVDLFTGSIIQRTYIVSRRIYEIVAVVNNSQREFEAVAVGVLDSFKVLSDAEVKARIAEETAKAEPSPLPQAPVPPRAGSDVSDEGLRSSVKSVLTETQEPSGRKRESLDTFNEQGNLIRSEWYDAKDNVSSIKVYGYIDGSRVSKVKDIDREYNPPPPLAVRTSPPPAAKKPDSRFQYRSEYKYDDKKRLTEETIFLSNGKLWVRKVYKYNGNQKEQLDYSDDGSLSQRIVYKLDGKGNEIEETVFDRHGSERYKTTYAYEFDMQGNWTRRTTSTVEITDDRKLPLPPVVHFRTITYY